MIAITNFIPPVKEPRAEWVRLRNIFECYRDEALFWVQNEGETYICLLDGDMTILNLSSDTDELFNFLRVISPASVFSDKNTIKALGITEATESFVMSNISRNHQKIDFDIPNSRSVFEMFKEAGLSLPSYEFFAVDFCRRINHGFADCFFMDNECAAYSIHTGEFALIQGLASLKKGGGSLALKKILQKNSGRTVLACCSADLCGFYEKNGFTMLYETAYGVNNNGIF